MLLFLRNAPGGSCFRKFGGTAPPFRTGGGPARKRHETCSGQPDTISMAVKDFHGHFFRKICRAAFYILILSD